VTAVEPHAAEKGDALQILWLLPAQLAKSIAGDRQEQRLLNLLLASARLRGGVASTFAMRAGHHNVFLDCDDPAAVGRVDLDTIDLCVVTKFFGTSNAGLWLDVLGRLVKNKRKVLVDICEYPFVAKKNAAISDFYNKALQYCDVMTVNSTRMQELMAPHLGRRPLVIEDAILEPLQKPKFVPGKVLKLLWFGHPTNYNYLATLIPSLKTFSQQQKCHLTIVSSPELKEKVPTVEKPLSAHFQIRFIAWSFLSQREALANCDLVLIPGDPADPRKSGASSNRIAETLQAGRFPVASPLGSYLPYEQAVWLGSDLIDGIRFALSQPQEVLIRIRRGQAQVKAAVMPSVVGKQWLALFESLAVAGGAVAPALKKKPVLQKPDVAETGKMKMPKAPTFSTYADAFYSKRKNTSDKWEHYFAIYDHLLSDRYGQKINYLEIGVQKGGGLETARTLFAPGSRLVGLDVDSKCKGLEADGIADRMFIGSQGDAATLKALTAYCPEFDVILDDGSHIQEHMITSFIRLFPVLAQGGIYIIEDTHTCYSPEHQQSFHGLGIYDYFKGLSERLNLDFIDPGLRKNRYKTPREKREAIRQIPDICREIFSIEFFDSVIAIRKRKKQEPLRIRR